MKNMFYLKNRLIKGVLFLTFLVSISCAKIEPVNFIPGTRACEHCKMDIVDMRFHTQVISSRGKMYPFDSIECMVLWTKDHPEMKTNMWLRNYISADVWLKLENAKIIKSDKIQSPMGANLVAIPKNEPLSSIPGGSEIEKEKLLEYINSLKVTKKSSESFSSNYH